MKIRPFRPLRLACALLLGLPACFGGGSDAAPAASEFRLVSCTLGCQGGTCSVNEQATNQEITLTFNDNVNPSTAHYGTISIIERGSGSVPPGQFIVSGRRVTFRPSLIETQSGASFGFREGRDYEIRLLAAPNSSVVRSTIQRPNTTPLSCVVRTSGVNDLVPGRPIVTVTPSNAQPPTTNSFLVRLVFNDLIQKNLLVDPLTQDSPTIQINIVDRTQGTPLIISVPGTFTATLDPDTITTTVQFLALAPYPGNAEQLGIARREVRVDVSSNIADLAGNTLVNAGAFFIPLLPSTQVDLSFAEEFDGQSQEDEGGSTAGLWASPVGSLDCGLNPVTGKHHGGGSGVLGVFAPGANIEFRTGYYDSDPEKDESMHFSADQTLTGEEIIVEGGVFFFEEVIIPSNVLITASGPNPLRIHSRGQINLAGLVSLDGQDADAAVSVAYPGVAYHPGKWLQPKERIDHPVRGEPLFTEPNGEELPNTEGGRAGLGTATGGNGGIGGDGWFNIKAGNSEPINSDPVDYFDVQANPGYKVEPSDPNPTRYTNFLAAKRVHGRSGDGVGARVPAGHPLAAPEELFGDWANGSGMGSWAWPPIANGLFDERMLIDGDSDNDILENVAAIETLEDLMPARKPDDLWWRMKAHKLTVGVDAGKYDCHSIYRARGGGGGGYWTQGDPGIHYFNGATDPTGLNLVIKDNVPAIEPDEGIYEYNYLFPLNAFRPTNDPNPDVDDAAGGRFDPDQVGPGFETLDPALGYLLGGAGGGGGGTSEHGSFNFEARQVPDEVGVCATFRSCSGCGGGSGGGAVQLHAGGRFSMNGRVQSRGGDGGNSRFMANLPSPEIVRLGGPAVAGGGGGSGGAVLLQSYGGFQVGTDRVVVTGGLGGLGDAGNFGGEGGSGVVRFDTPTGTESLQDLQNFVDPNVAVSLAPFGQPMDVNVGVFEGDFPGSLGDVGAFNANASGVRSLWYEPPSLDLVFLSYTGWTVEVEYSDGSQTFQRTYTDGAGDFPVPGVDPLWLAFQTGWGLPANPGDPSLPAPDSLSTWIIPGHDGVAGGLSQMNGQISRLLRFQIVFDQDLVKALIGNAPGAYYRVKSMDVAWSGE